MMKNYKSILKNIFALVIMCFIFKSYAQTDWTLMNPKPSYNNAMDVEFVSSTTGFIMNETQLLKTVNTGLTWELTSTTFNYAKDMTFKNGIGFIVGLSGLVMKSTDNGENWSQVNTTFNYAYTCVNIVDNQTIILSSSNRIVKSIDGGITWQSITLTGFENINRICFTSPLVGHAACNNGEIMKTINGGTNWYVTETVSTSPSNFIAIYFIDQNTGFASREHDEIFKTTNGGESWTMLTPGVNELMNCIYFTDQNTGFAAGEDGFIFKTTNGGTTWSQISYVGGNGFSNYYGIYFLNNTTGFVVGQRGRIAKTTDGGVTWTEYSPTYNDIVKVQFVTDTVGYALINIGSKFLKTTDGGNTWQIVGSLFIDTGSYGSDFTFVDENIGYATTTNHGRIYKTTDGGVNWTVSFSGPSVLNDGTNSKVCFYNQNIGFAMGGFNSQRTSKTINGGASWQQVANHSFNDMRFLTSDLGFALWGGIIKKTTDGGINWSDIGQGITGISSYYAFDENTIYAISGTTFRKTADGGVNWQTYNLLNAGPYTQMKFYNTQIGYILRQGDTVFRTVNGGITWNSLAGSSNYGINYLDLSGTKITTAGFGGVIKGTAIPQTLSVDELVNENDFVIIYPNPTTGILNIQASGNQRIEKAELYDYLGKNIKHVENTDQMNTVSIDCSNMPQGIYLVKIHSSDGAVQNNKILIK